MTKKKDGGIRRAVKPIQKGTRRFLGEFKAFALRGNVMDLAVGVIIGGAFGKITTSLVNDIIMPLISMIAGSIDLSSLFIALDGKYYKERTDVGGDVAVLAYGSFLTTVLDFLIIAFFVFLMVKFLGKLRLKEKEQAPPPAPVPTQKECPFCKTNIPVGAVRCPNCTSVLEEG